MSRRVDGIGLGAVLRRHFGARQDAFTSALFVFPLFLVYQIGILTGARGRNGADFVTSAMIRLCHSDLGLYLLLLAVASGVYVGLLLWLRGRHTAHSRLFLPMLCESAVYASLMGVLIRSLIVRFDRFLPILAIGPVGPFDVLVISAGAGLHEELVFRAGLLVMLIRLFELPTIPLGRIGGTLLALLLSSVAFAAVHHMGGAGEPFTAVAFVYRIFAGAIFGLIYLYRGLGIAAWTHALYDVMVLGFG
jgi:membrane protease YdiL (CAAX protease family)